jgi:hypothetical protein
MMFSVRTVERHLSSFCHVGKTDAGFSLCRVFIGTFALPVMPACDSGSPAPAMMAVAAGEKIARVQIIVRPGFTPVS